jgi:outer membrane protein OmpA-like peptidoglycan-associated protein
VKRFLPALGILAGVLLLPWHYLQTTPHAPSPLHLPWPGDLVTPSQAAPAVSRETISLTEVRAMVADMAPLRVAFAEFYMTNDSLPRNFDDVGLPAPPHTRLLGNGSIEYLAGGRPAARVFWRARPTSLRIDWDCVSPDIVNLAERVQGCRYLPSFRPDDPIRVNYSHNHRLLFEFDRSSEEGLSAGERTAFQQFLANALRKPGYHPQAAQITGYADPMGDAKRNIRLAEGRAAYVREALAAVGLDRSAINVRVIGADPRPVRDCPASLSREERIQCFGASRRVDIVLSGQRDL